MPTLCLLVAKRPDPVRRLGAHIRRAAAARPSLEADIHAKG